MVIGDKVWYLDLSYEQQPKIRQSIISHIIGFGVCRLENYERSIDMDSLFTTKEALIASLEPTIYGFNKGQLVYVCGFKDNQQFVIRRFIVHCAGYNRDYIGLYDGFGYNYTEVPKEQVFKTIQELLEYEKW